MKKLTEAQFSAIFDHLEETSNNFADMEKKALEVGKVLLASGLIDQNWFDGMMAETFEIYHL